MMDQGGNPSQHEDSNYNLYTYGTDMDDDVTATVGGGDSAFPLGSGGGWDHHHGVDDLGHYPDVTTHGTPYDTSTTPMDDFGSTHYGHEFHQGQTFEHVGHQFQDFMTQGELHVGNDGYDINSMDLYNATSIYPDLGQGTTDYGT